MSTPRATYRIQLRPDFDFDAAAAVAHYLAALGVSHFYASPYLQAAPGSTHGYDVVDPTRVNRELGGEPGHRRFQDALSAAGLGQVLDIVPNHMAITGPENAWWWDVLRNGPASAYAPYFDVDWDPPEPKLRNHVLMPVLADHYGRELEAGAIRLEHDGGSFRVCYHDHALPVAPRSLADILEEAADRVTASREDADRQWAGELGFLGRAFGGLPEAGVERETERAIRRRDLAVLDGRIGDLVRDRPSVRTAIDAVVAVINADPDRLDHLLSAQNYRLARWRTARQELDYRRFFDIDSLAALRTEDPEVFDAVHARVLEWLEAGVIDGVRVDHPDGLRTPGQYFSRLRAAAPDAWIVAEKILMPEERLPPWPVDGTTGYDALNDVGGLFVDPAGEAPLTALWTAWTGDDRPFHDVAYEARHDVLRDVLGADLNRLANIFVGLCESRRRYRDFMRRELREALAEVAACFPVYRAYVDEEGQASDADRRVVERAVASASDRRPELDTELLEFLRRILLGEVEEPRARALRMRLQQLTGPVAAKGEEDTAFYRYVRFTPLNEVGGDPGRWGLAPASFHERAVRRAREWPRSMTSLSTHDTKRSEDVRARLFLLSEVPDRWAEAVSGWRAMNARHWPSDVDPDPRMEYLLYQAVVGAWPIDADRLARYMEKASREAKLRTSWTDPDPRYDEALATFVARIMDGGFMAELERFVEPLIAPGRVVSMAQKLVQLAMPGIPDLYQGTELWDLSLVDPDNRRPVDFDARRAALERLGAAAAAPPGDGMDGAEDAAVDEVVTEMGSGLPKMWVVREALAARRERPRAFGPDGGYEAIEMSGGAADHAVGFVRGGEVAVVVPRLVIGLTRSGGWSGTSARIPPGTWRNRFTGRSVVTDGGGVAVADLLARFPVALLEREDG